MMIISLRFTDVARIADAAAGKELKKINKINNLSDLIEKIQDWLRGTTDKKQALKGKALVSLSRATDSILQISAAERIAAWVTFIQCFSEEHTHRFQMSIIPPEADPDNLRFIFKININADEVWTREVYIPNTPTYSGQHQIDSDWSLEKLKGLIDFNPWLARCLEAECDIRTLPQSWHKITQCFPSDYELVPAIAQDEYGVEELTFTLCKKNGPDSGDVKIFAAPISREKRAYVLAFTAAIDALNTLNKTHALQKEEDEYYPFDQVSDNAKDRVFLAKIIEKEKSGKIEYTHDQLERIERGKVTEGDNGAPCEVFFAHFKNGLPPLKFSDRISGVELRGPNLIVEMLDDQGFTSLTNLLVVPVGSAKDSVMHYLKNNSDKRAGASLDKEISDQEKAMIAQRLSPLPIGKTTWGALSEVQETREIVAKILALLGDVIDLPAESNPASSGLDVLLQLLEQRLHADFAQALNLIVKHGNDLFWLNDFIPKLEKIHQVATRYPKIADALAEFEERLFRDMVQQMQQVIDDVVLDSWIKDSPKNLVLLLEIQRFINQRYSRERPMLDIERIVGKGGVLCALLRPSYIGLTQEQKNKIYWHRLVSFYHKEIGKVTSEFGADNSAELGEKFVKQYPLLNQEMKIFIEERRDEILSNLAERFTDLQDNRFLWRDDVKKSWVPVLRQGDTAFYTSGIPTAFLLGVLVGAGNS